MTSTRSLLQSTFSRRVAVLTVGSAVVNFFINSQALADWFRPRLATIFTGVSRGEIDYLVFIGRALASGLMLVLLVYLVIRLEKPVSIRGFFKIGPVDLIGIGLIILFVGILDGLEIGFLRRLIYEPARLFLASLGLPGQPTLDVNLAPDPHLFGVNILLLLLVFWIEVPEELFFRGYVQNHLQEYVGVNAALFVGAAIWACWHLFALADVARILVLGLAFSLVFRLRQNTTPLAIWHPLGNRLLLLVSLIGAVIGQSR